MLCIQSMYSQITVNVHLTGLRSDSLVLITGQGRDTLVATRGDIQITSDCPSLFLASLFELPPAGEPLQHGVSLYALPDEVLYVKGTLRNVVFSGSETYRQINDFNLAQKPYSSLLDSLCDGYRIDAEAASDPQAKKVIDSKYVPAIREASDSYQNFLLAYVEQHPDDDASCIAAIYYKDFYKAYNLLTERVRHGRLSPLLISAKAFTDRNLQMREQEKAISKAGTPAPDFTLKDIDGNTVSLASLRGSYVLLDFWGSWCKWCIKGLPNLKRLHNKYKDTTQLRIVSIDCNDTPEKWKTAVRQNGMTWLQLKCELEDNVLTAYAVRAFPTFVLIKPDGTISCRFEGESQDMYLKIESILSNNQ